MMLGCRSRDAHCFFDECHRRGGIPLKVIRQRGIARHVAQIAQTSLGRDAIGLQRLDGVLARLWMRIVVRHGCQRRHGGCTR